MNKMLPTEILKLFEEENFENLAIWQGACINLKKEPKEEDVEALFRSIHNIKGSSGSLGYTDTTSFLHEIEDVVSGYRESFESFPKDHISLLLKSHDLIEGWLKNLGSEDAEIPKDQARLILDGFSKDGSINMASLQKLKDAPLVQNTSELVPKSVRKKLLHRRSEIMRVPSDKIDQFIDQLGEINIHIAILERFFDRKDVEPSVAEQSAHLCARSLKHLQRISLSLRTVDLKPLFRKLELAADEVCTKLGKNVELKMSGELTRVDKAVAEELVNPLLHMLRNCIDHGIEDEESRKKKNKTVKGVIKITAANRANQVEITIEDDGSGLDPFEIRKKALASNIISKDEKLSNDQIFELILHPGFSTANEVSEVSGRGVGMDVVRETTENLRGNLQISSKKDAGTKFILSLPTDFNVLKAVIIRAGEQRIAIPLAELDEVIAFTKNDQSEEGIIFYNENAIPCLSLNNYLGIDKSSELGVFNEQTRNENALIIPILFEFSV